MVRDRTPFPGAPRERLLRELVRGQIGRMVNDVLAETRDRLADSGAATVEDVRAAGRALCGFSDAMRAEERALKKFMYARLYLHPEQIAAAERAREVIATLFAAYAADPGLLPEAWRSRLPDEEPGRSRTIADYIAGMTDRFAIESYEQVTGTVPEGLRNV